jgi:hypothetical protein
LRKSLNRIYLQNIFLNFEVLTAVVMKMSISWNIVRGKSAYVSEENIASETSVDFQRTIRRYIPEPFRLLKSVALRISDRAVITLGKCKSNVDL